jgi:hypothetical protein
VFFLHLGELGLETALKSWVLSHFDLKEHPINSIMDSHVATSLYAKDEKHPVVFMVVKRTCVFIHEIYSTVATSPTFQRQEYSYWEW